MQPLFPPTQRGTFLADDDHDDEVMKIDFRSVLGKEQKTFKGHHESCESYMVILNLFHLAVFSLFNDFV